MCHPVVRGRQLKNSLFGVLDFRGQVLNAEMISNLVDVELILDGIKYSVKVARVQLTGRW